MPRNKSFAPWYYYVKVAFLLGSAVSLEAYIHYNRAYYWYLTAPLGLIFAWIGKNLAQEYCRKKHLENYCYMP